MFCVSNDALRNSLWESLCDALNDSLKSVYKGVEYVLCV